ncbi:hypothetical protein DBV15_11530 [Temnothorax longispinosus]|uniref:Uncharacterized protein n=1 Tax=Temnothorax longispinosus TaxID=300112 RepID=A0A4S2JIX1_9HYME|nr:hypothetical protein DBV15_11530 [Temnothorax longispinosus]
MSFNSDGIRSSRVQQGVQSHSKYMHSIRNLHLARSLASGFTCGHNKHLHESSSKVQKYK